MMASRARTGSRSVGIAAGAALVLLSCSHPPAAPAPARNAEPGAVLAAYLADLRAGDCRSAHALTTTTFEGKGNGELCGDLKVTAYTRPVGPAGSADRELTYGTTLTTNGSGDGSIPDGLITWFYSLAKQSDGSWRLVSGGSGP